MGCLCSFKIDTPNYLKTHSLGYMNTYSSPSLSLTSHFLSKSFKLEYKLEKDILGSGLFGQIRLCQKISTKKLFAVKIISKKCLHPDQLNSDIIMAQFRLMSQTDHPSIIKLVDYFEDNSNYYLVMDYIQADDLLSNLQKNGRFSEKVAARVMKQVLTSLAYLHSKQIVHRDVKCENILFQASQNFPIIKLIDFDTAVQLKNGTCKGRYGTVYYMAPEVIQGEYDEKCDVWSAGVVLYSMITKSFPFGGSSDNEIMRNIAKGKIDFSAIASKASKELIEFLKELLNPNRKTRISASQACHHPWILSYCAVPISKDCFNICSELDLVVCRALKIWVVKNIIPAKELGKYHLMYVNLDKDFDGWLNEEDLGNLINEPNCLFISSSDKENGIGYYEFLSLALEQDIFSKYKTEIFRALSKFSLEKVSDSSLIYFLENKLNRKILLDANSKSGEIDIQDLFSLIVS